VSAAAVGVADWVGLGVAVLLVGYLLLALLFPERF
jgi:K+-transporting ATPase KdpF subunit